MSNVVVAEVENLQASRQGVRGDVTKVVVPQPKLLPSVQFEVGAGDGGMGMG
jgi:hypothetical protein